MKTQLFAVAALVAFSFQIGNAASVLKTTQKPKSSNRKPVQVSVPKVTENNFVSLTFDVSGGYVGVHSKLLLDAQHITFSDPRRNTITTATWIRKERAPFFKGLNDAKFPNLVGNYKQKNLADGFNETVTLKLRQGKAVRVFTVQNYGDRAPKGYYKITTWLRNFQNQKFPANGSGTFYFEF